MTHDVRAIANLILDLADAEERPITNMAINKIVFFLHSHFLVEFGRPLVSAKIEAWQHGPVFRELFKQFKAYGDQSISSRAMYLDPKSGDWKMATHELSERELNFVTAAAAKYIPMSASELRALSHQRGGPWDQVWNHDTIARATMRISNEAIRSWYKNAARH